jgi:CRISPR-associated protein Cas5d
MKVERVSYPVMTPSAARGILESIFWKPEFAWRVQRIRVLKPIRHFSVLRNETGRKLSPVSVARWMESGEPDRFLIDDDREQRNTLGLRDVDYVIEARMNLREGRQASDGAKYREQFYRRVAKGQCYTRPALGCREFAAFFGPAENGEEPHQLSADLGLMLFDLRYDRKTNRGTPVFFPARLEGGVLRVPPHLYEEVGL